MNPLPPGFNALLVVNTFFAVLIAGTAWRLLAAHAMASNSPGLKTAGKAMSFQY